MRYVLEAMFATIFYVVTLKLFKFLMMITYRMNIIIKHINRQY